MYVFVCATSDATGFQPAGAMSAADVPTCTNAQASWVHVADLPVSSSLATTLTLTDAAALLGATMFAMAVAWGFRQVFDFTQNRR